MPINLRVTKDAEAAAAAPEKATKGLGSSKLVFSGKHFPTEDKVQKYLADNQWSGFSLAKKGADFEVTPVDTEIEWQGKARKVRMADGVDGYVQSWVAKTPVTVDSTMAETDLSHGVLDGGAGGAIQPEEDTVQLEDEAGAKKPTTNNGPLKPKGEVPTTGTTVNKDAKQEHALKFRSWFYYSDYDDETNAADSFVDFVQIGIEDRIPPGVCELNDVLWNSVRAILKNDTTTVEQKAAMLTQSGADFAELIMTLYVVFMPFMQDEDGTLAQKTVKKTAGTPHSAALEAVMKEWNENIMSKAPMREHDAKDAKPKSVIKDAIPNTMDASVVTGIPGNELSPVPSGQGKELSTTTVAGGGIPSNDSVTPVTGSGSINDGGGVPQEVVDNPKTVAKDGETPAAKVKDPDVDASTDNGDNVTSPKPVKKDDEEDATMSAKSLQTFADMVAKSVAAALAPVTKRIDEIAATVDTVKKSADESRTLVAKVAAQSPTKKSVTSDPIDTASQEKASKAAEQERAAKAQDLRNALGL